MELFWFRRDLRLKDNLGLINALSTGKVLAIFCLEKSLLKLSTNRAQFLIQSLQELDHNLKKHNSKLLILEGPAVKAIPQLLKNNQQITELHFNQDYSEYSRSRDEALTKKVTQKITTYVDQVILAGKVSKKDGSAYTVFTPYSKRWWELLEADGGIESLTISEPELKNFVNVHEIDELSLQDIEQVDINKLAESFPTNSKLIVRGGETEAAKLAGQFFYANKANKQLGPISNYHVDRDRVDIEGTSKLSAALKFGTISIRSLFYTAAKLRTWASSSEIKGINSWLNELIWREFYFNILEHFPKVEKLEFKENFRGLSWDNKAEWISAWKAGRTGYPFIDASMRQLAQAGWMHNRGRMAVAMFLTKDLLCDWRIGEEHFMSLLVDGDTAANNGGWQWSAGTGTDAAPYFRIFNPTTQGLKCDPNGDFVREWIPELRSIQGKAVHDPSHQQRKETGYPQPIVDHKQQRQKALAMYAN